jgi:hypothetical protein
MSTGVVPAIPLQHFDGPGGVPLADGLLYTYRTGTTTPAPTYLDATLTPASANTNPIVLNARGECVTWLDSEITYRWVLKDKHGATIWTQDNISGVIGSGIFKSPATEVQTAAAGQTLFALGTVSYAPGTGNLEVVVNGLELTSGTDYAETSATSVTLVSPLDVGDEVLFKSGGRLTSSAVSELDVAYTYPGTAAIASTLRTKMDAIAANPEDWGALGDGITDDTAAFQLAINWLQSSGAEHMSLLLGAKPYRIAGTLTVTGAVHISGEGYTTIEAGRPITRPAKGTWLIHASATGPLFRITGAGSKGCSLTDIAIFQEGHPAPQPGWAPSVRDWVIRAEGMEGELFLDRLHFHNVYRGILCDQSHRPRFGHISGQFFSRAITFDRIYDTGSLRDLHAWTFWSEDDSVLTWSQANGIAVSFGRVDGMDLGSIFTFALAQGIYCGASPAGAAGGARVINVKRLYADFTGRALVIDVTACHVTVDALFHLGQAWPVAPVASLPGSCALHVASGSNALLQLSNLYSVLSEGSAVKVEGASNQVWISNPRIEQYDVANTGAGAYYVAATGTVFLGNPDTPLTYLGAAGPTTTGAGNVRGQVPVQFLAGADTNKPVTAANGPGQLAVVTVEGEADAGLSVLAKTTGIVNLGSADNKLAFFGSGAAVKQAITGSRGGNAALASLLTALAAHGLITDSTTA